mgnify:CR=1 FL=1
MGDDDTNSCELRRLCTNKEGYQVTTANDGEEGLEKVNQLKPDTVLLDVMMPRMDGLEVCRLRSDIHWAGMFFRDFVSAFNHHVLKAFSLPKVQQH